MKTIITALLFLIPTIIFAQTDRDLSGTIRGAYPVMCVPMEEVAKTIEEFEEEPFITALSHRDTGDGKPVPFAMVIFYNYKTGTFTIGEKIADKICIVAAGENLKPYVEEQEEKKSDDKRKDFLESMM